MTAPAAMPTGPPVAPVAPPRAAPAVVAAPLANIRPATLRAACVMVVVPPGIRDRRARVAPLPERMPAPLPDRVATAVAQPSYSGASGRYSFSLSASSRLMRTFGAQTELKAAPRPLSAIISSYFLATSRRWAHRISGILWACDLGMSMTRGPVARPQACIRPRGMRTSSGQWARGTLSMSSWISSSSAPASMASSTFRTCELRTWRTCGPPAGLSSGSSGISSRIRSMLGGPGRVGA